MSKFCTWQLSSYFSSHLCISHGAGLHFWRGHTIFKMFKKTICKSVCTYLMIRCWPSSHWYTVHYWAVLRIRICIIFGSQIRFLSDSKAGSASKSKAGFESASKSKGSSGSASNCTHYRALDPCGAGSGSFRFAASAKKEKKTFSEKEGTVLFYLGGIFQVSGGGRGGGMTAVGGPLLHLRAPHRRCCCCCSCCWRRGVQRRVLLSEKCLEGHVQMVFRLGRLICRNLVVHQVNLNR